MSGHRFECREAVEGQLAQCVDTTAQHHVAYPQVEQALGTHQSAGAGGAGGGDHVGRAAQLQPVGEKVRRRAEFLLLVVVVGRELLFAHVEGQALAGFIDARSAGAQHDPDTVAAIAPDGLIDVGANLQRGLHQQLIVAAALAGQLDGNRHEFTRDRTHRQ
ncbi:hypothetical protein D9M71_473000 [compost metagenome]